MFAFVSMVLAALGWSGFDASRKALAGRLESMPLVVALMLGQVPIFGVWLWIDGMPDVGWDYLPPAAISIAVNVLSNLLFVLAVRISPLSVTIPMLSFSPVFSAAIAALPPLHEIPTPLKAAGALTVVVGALLLNSAGAGGFAPRKLLTAVRHERGALIMLAVAFLFAATSVVDKIASGRSSAPWHAMIQCLGVGVTLLVALAVRRRLASLAPLRGLWLRYTGALSLGAAALGFQMVAFRLNDVSAVETTKRAVGMTAALIIGRVAFGEPLHWSKWLAVVLMAAGCWMIVAH